MQFSNSPYNYHKSGHSPPLWWCQNTFPNSRLITSSAEPVKWSRVLSAHSPEGQTQTNTRPALTCCLCSTPQEGLQNSSCLKQASAESSQAVKKLELESTEQTLRARWLPGPAPPLQVRCNHCTMLPAWPLLAGETRAHQHWTLVCLTSFPIDPSYEREKDHWVPLITWPDSNGKRDRLCSCKRAFSKDAAPSVEPIYSESRLGWLYVFS